MNGENTPGHDLPQGQPLGPAISRPGTKGASASVGSANMLPPFVPRAPEPPAVEPLPVDDLLLSVPEQEPADPAGAGLSVDAAETAEEIEIQQPRDSWLSHVERAEELFVSEERAAPAGGPGAEELPWLMVEDDTKMPAEEEGAGAPYLRLVDEEGGDAADSAALDTAASTDGEASAESIPNWMSWDESEEPEAPADVGLIESTPQLTPWEERPLDGLLPEEDVAFMEPAWKEDAQPQPDSASGDAGVIPIDAGGPDEEDAADRASDEHPVAGAWTADAWTADDTRAGGDVTDAPTAGEAAGQPSLERVDERGADEEDSPWTDAADLAGSAGEGAWGVPLDETASPDVPAVAGSAGEDFDSAAFSGDSPRETARGDEPVDDLPMVASSLDDELDFAPAGADEEAGAVSAGALELDDPGTEGVPLSFADAVAGETEHAAPTASARDGYGEGVGAAEAYADRDADAAHDGSDEDELSFAPSGADAGGADHGGHGVAEDLYVPEAAAMEPVDDLIGGGGGAAAAPEDGAGAAAGAAPGPGRSTYDSSADAPASPLHEVAARLEEIAASLRTRTPADLLSGASDPLEIMIAGYVLGYTRGATGPGPRAGE